MDGYVRKKCSLTFSQYIFWGPLKCKTQKPIERRIFLKETNSENFLLVSISTTYTNFAQTAVLGRIDVLDLDRISGQTNIFNEIIFLVIPYIIDESYPKGMMTEMAACQR